ncbi:MAG: GtrA family protein [Pseudomonadota bacterium]
MSMVDRLLKFFTVGGVTTLFGVTLYGLLLLVLNANLFLAYVIVFAASVTFSYFLNARFNYRIAPSLRTYIHYVQSYAVGFAAGFVLITICKALAVPLADFWIAMLSIPFRFAITFLLADRAMVAREPAEPHVKTK